MSPGHETGTVGWRDWAAWLLAASCLFFQFVVQIQPSAMIEELESTFAVDAVELGLLASAYFVTSISLQIPVGWLLDRFGPRSVLVTSMILGAAGLVWFGSAATLDSAIGARVILGIAGAPAFASAALVASRRFPARRFGLMLGLTESFTLLGGVAVALLLPTLGQWTTRAGSGFVLAGCSLLLGIGCFFLVGGRTTPTDGGSSSAGQPAKASLLRTLFEPRLWLAGIHGGIFFGVIAAFGGLWAAPFFRARLDIDPADATFPVAILFAAGVFGAPLLGLIAGSRSWRGPTLIIASIVCAIAGFAMVNIDMSEWILFMLVAILGFFAGVFAVDMACVRDASDPGRRGLAIGTANMLLGIVGGPVMVMLVARALDATSGTDAVNPMLASMDQIRSAMNWFVGPLVLAVPMAIILVFALRFGARRGDSIS